MYDGDDFAQSNEKLAECEKLIELTDCMIEMVDEKYDIPTITHSNAKFARFVEQMIKNYDFVDENDYTINLTFD